MMDFKAGVGKVQDVRKKNEVLKEWWGQEKQQRSQYEGLSTGQI